MRNTLYSLLTTYSPTPYTPWPQSHPPPSHLLFLPLHLSLQLFHSLFPKRQRLSQLLPACHQPQFLLHYSVSCHFQSCNCPSPYAHTIVQIQNNLIPCLFSVFRHCYLRLLRSRSPNSNHRPPTSKTLATSSDQLTDQQLVLYIPNNPPS